ncbi:MAG: UDP-2,3-diacylglucosamine diphosphatase [Cocleimonas sp.]|nr:UDP-2,3-diacylglucosamine diphosphatase [Cocleimonas sp.]
MKDSKKNNTYFISDLHLDESHPLLFKLFYEFIDNIKDKAETLYILGDLFEFWIGDDIIDLPIGKPYLPVIEKLKALSDSGTKIYFIQGNRDFLISKVFMQRIGGELLPDEKVIDLYGTSTLIMHGDTLCTDDKAYQRMRKIFRIKLVQKLYLSMNPEKRNQKANQIRQRSGQKTKQKTSMILDVNQQQVETSCKSGGVCFLIHGHTHRPAEHEFKLDNKTAKRIVLGDWRDKACYLRVNGSEFELVY